MRVDANSLPLIKRPDTLARRTRSRRGSMLLSSTTCKQYRKEQQSMSYGLGRRRQLQCGAWEHAPGSVMHCPVGDTAGPQKHAPAAQHQLAHARVQSARVYLLPIHS